MIRQRAEAHGLSVTQHFLEGPDAAFPFDDKAFEIGVTVQVLMHVPDEHIETSIKELIWTTCTSVVVASREPHPGSKPAHVFSHDYEALFVKLGATITKV